MRELIAAGCWLLMLGVFGWSQTLDRVPAELVQYPDLVLHSGKIVTVDDHSLSKELGTIAQAMAVRGEKILAVGTNDSVRKLAGPNTKVIDLKGRTVLPGLISVHEHPYDWTHRSGVSIRSVIRDDSVIVARYLRGSPQEQMQAFDATLREAVQKAKPGQFIWIHMERGEQDQWRSEVAGLLGRELTRGRLDRLAPNNPVAVNAGTNGLYNTKTLEAYRKVYPDWENYSVAEQGEAAGLRELGRTGPFVQRRILNDVMWADQTDMLAEVFKAEMSWWTGYGITTVGTSVEGFNAVDALARLGRKQSLPMRQAWMYSGPIFEEPYFLRSLAAMIGSGSDYFWFLGALPETVLASCSTAPAPREVKAQEECVLAPGMPARRKLYGLLKAGGRVGTLHTVGDKDIDYYMDIIEEASRDAGFTPEEIRAKRHVFDHCALAPRPDQIPRIQRLGIIVSCNNMYLYREILRTTKTYGEGVAGWVSPRKGLIDGGVMTVMELDRPLAHTIFTAFHYLEWGVTRRGEDGKVRAPEQRVDRQTMLKIATVFGGYYLLREDRIGSLEPGKLADFIVLDRDYLTIPEEEISEIKVLMTIVGGKPVHLAPSLAGEIGWPSVGAQVELGHIR